MTWGRVGGFAIALVLVLLPASAAADEPPEVVGSAYVLVDGPTGEVLASRAADRRQAMASTTKLMTALVALELADADDVLTIPPQARIGEASARLIPGERLSVGDLLSALLVGSGNDAALALAVALSGSEQAFVERMNGRARRMGLDDTHFANAHGLDAPGHYASARDLVALGRAAMRRPEIRDRVRLRRVTIAGGRVLESKNHLLDLDRSADGIKTGHTAGAGYALVARAWRPPAGPIYLALIGSSGERQRALDAKALLDWGFTRFASGRLLPARQPVAEVQLVGTGGTRVPVVAPRALTVPLRVGTPVVQRVTIASSVAPPVARGQRLGVIEFHQGDRLLGRRALVADRSVDSPSLWGRVRAGLSGVLDFDL